MIHKIIVIDQNTTVGQILFDDGIIKLKTDLLTGFISALSAFSKCLGEKSIEFKGADLGDNRFSLITRDNLTYAVFQDLYDNEPFAKKTLQEIIDIYHDEIKTHNLAMERINKHIKNEIKNLIETEYFPLGILKSNDDKIKKILQNSPLNIKLLFLASITNGIITVWKRPSNPVTMKEFLDIISKIPLEMNWLAEGKTGTASFNGFLNDTDTQLEAWMIKRVSTSNFYVAAKATSTMMESNKELSLNLSLLVEQISSILENSLEYEWLKATING